MKLNRFDRLNKLVRILWWSSVVAGLTLGTTTSRTWLERTAQLRTPQFQLFWSSFESDATSSVAWGDVDNDGDLDLAVGSRDAPSRLYLNIGGTLTTEASLSFAAEDATTSLAWGDVDNDGDLDLAMGNAGPNRLYRNEAGLLNTTPVWASAEEEETTSLAWGDVDNDGDLDLVVGNRGAPNRLYLNEAGTLSTSAVWASAETDDTSSVAWGDMDHDGDLDLAVGNFNAQPNRLYLNRGGTLGTEAVWSSTETDRTSAVAWGDVDNDGFLDLAAGNSGKNRLYHNENGRLSPQAAWSSNETDPTSSIAWGDFNNDGHLDLAVGNGECCPNSQHNRIYAGNGKSLSSSAVWSSTETDETVAIAWGDFNNDGFLDLVAGNSGPDRLYRNDLEMFVPVSPDLIRDAAKTRSVAWGDVDGDGDLDLAVGNFNRTPNRVFINQNGRLVTDTVWIAPEPDDTLSVAWGDVDGDGDLDLAVGNHGPNRLYRNEAGQLAAEIAWRSEERYYSTSVAWGDVDGDGDLDLAVGNGRCCQTGEPNQVYLNQNGRLSTTADWVSGEIDQTSSVAWGDVDGDGDLDLAVGNISETPNRLYFNQGGQLIEQAGWFSSETDETTSVAWGDVDGDGDLDLAVGNFDQPNRLYRNDNGILTTSAVWTSVEADETTRVVWGDVDGDGDLDLFAGNTTLTTLYRNEGGTLTTSGVWRIPGNQRTMDLALGDADGDGDLDLALGNTEQANRVLFNVRRSRLPGLNTPPTLVLGRPDHTAAAAYFSTATILEEAQIAIPYTLYDREGDPVPRIFAEFSPNGGGQWLPATAGEGGDGLTNLATSPTGVPHTFVWHAEEDLIKSDNVVFRIRAQPGYTHTPIYWPAVASQSPAFRVASPWYVHVVDSVGNPVAGASVYANGKLLGTTNFQGLLNPGPLAEGTALVAVAQQLEEPTQRDAHDGWAYRVYLTSLEWDAKGEAIPWYVQRAGEQRLVLHPKSPLILFNLVVSIEWDADEAYFKQIIQALRHASDYLLDLTDGQMAFGQVHIYDNAAHWAAADIQISTKNIVRPHAYIGGLTSEDTSHVIRVGRYWDGTSGNQGTWDQPDGYRTLVHEFGHYALYLYDSYFAYLFDENDNLIGEVPAYCTGPENRDPASDATNASAMDYQYASSELAMRDLNGLWSSLCEQTAQWQLNGESDWETLLRHYSDKAEPVRWRLTTPADRGAVLPGPTALPAVLPPWPEIITHPDSGGEPAIPRQLTIYGPQGRYWGAIVALYKQDGRVIGQGFTDSNGQLDIYGAIEGDIIRAASFDGGLAGNVTIANETQLSLVMEPAGLLAGLGPQALPAPPHMRIVPEPSQTPDQIELLISLQNFGPQADPSLVITEPGSEVGHAPILSYSPSTGTYEAQISFSATERGMGRVRVTGAVGNSLVRLYSTYRLQRAIAHQPQDVYSNDGLLSLHLAPGSLPGNEAYLVVMPPGAIPGPAPTGLTLVGDPYDITASGALVTLEEPAVLRMHIDGKLVEGLVEPADLQIYHWQPATQTWIAVPATLDEEHLALVASVTTLGTYALMAPVVTEPGPAPVYLPFIGRSVTE